MDRWERSESRVVRRGPKSVYHKEIKVFHLFKDDPIPPSTFPIVI